MSQSERHGDKTEIFKRMCTLFFLDNDEMMSMWEWEDFLQWGIDTDWNRNHAILSATLL